MQDRPDRGLRVRREPPQTQNLLGSDINYINKWVPKDYYMYMYFLVVDVFCGLCYGREL